MTATPIIMPELCETHKQLLASQTGFGPEDAWQALIVITQITLFQGASCCDKIHAKVGGKIEKVSELGCLACEKPDLFGEIIEAIGASGDLARIKELGLRWVNEKTEQLKGGA